MTRSAVKCLFNTNNAKLNVRTKKFAYVSELSVGLELGGGGGGGGSSNGLAAGQVGGVAMIFHIC